jgi:hypothetical protein
MRFQAAIDEHQQRHQRIIGQQRPSKHISALPTFFAERISGQAAGGFAGRGCTGLIGGNNATASRVDAWSGLNDWSAGHPCHLRSFFPHLDQQFRPSEILEGVSNASINRAASAFVLLFFLRPQKSVAAS